MRVESGVYLTAKAFGADQAGDPMPAPNALGVESDASDVFLSIFPVPIFKTLRVWVVDLQGDEIQIRMWRRVFDAFNREYPFVNLEPDFGNPQPDAPHDVLIAQLPLCRHLARAKAVGR